MRSSKVFVVDLDETLTEGGETRVKDNVRRSLIGLRDSGWTLILATGRDITYLMRREDIKGVFHAWIAEAGLSYIIHGRGLVKVNAPVGWLEAVSSLRNLGYVQVKDHTVSVKERYLHELEGELSRLGIKARLVNNKGNVILLPEGVSKMSALRMLLDDLGVRGFVAAVGDSEVDVELLRGVDFSAAVANAEPGVKEVVDYVASRPDGDGVVEVIGVLLKRFGTPDTSS